MKILYTEVDTSYACKELGNELIKALPYIGTVIGEYRLREDDRTLVIVRTCPCCKRDSYMDIEGAILVSPFKGISTQEYGSIHRVNKYPPFRTPGHDGEANDMGEFMDELRKTINQALGV